ncbi:MAG: nagA 1, partial [Verrucomicrobiaceae bacterium]|nr:nagA 1 [Verrucomicrobiaceae bacterium]
WKTEPAYKGIRTGNIIHCEGGYIAESKAYDNKGDTVKKFSMSDGGGHQKAWLEAIRQGKLISDNQSVLQGYLSASLAHLANISWRVGKKMKREELYERLKGDKEALATLEDFDGNLRANKIDMDVDLAVVGPWLTMDPATERFTGEFADEANKLADEEYREEFKLPVIG